MKCCQVLRGARLCMGTAMRATPTGSTHWTHSHGRAPQARTASSSICAEPPDEIPSLAIVLDLCVGMRVNLEIKNYSRDSLLPTAMLHLSRRDTA